MMHQSALIASAEAVGVPGRRARKARAVRLALFEAGLRAFDRQPIGLVSVFDITEGADVAKGVFYLHFRSRDEFLIALCEYVKHSLFLRLRSDGTSLRSLEQRVREIARGYLRFISEEPAAARFWIRMSSFFNDEIGAPGRLESIRRSYIEELAELISGKANGSTIGMLDVQRALILDGCVWGLSRSWTQHVAMMPAKDATVDLISASVCTASRRRLLRNPSASAPLKQPIRKNSADQTLPGSQGPRR